MGKKVRVPIHGPKKRRVISTSAGADISDPEDSEAFAAFKEEYFDPSSRQGLGGPNTAVLLQLDEDDQEKAESMLIDTLSPDSIDAFDALGYFKCERAIPALKKLLRKAKGLSRIHLAEALWRIGRYDPALEILCSIASKRRIFDYGYLRAAAIGSMRDIEDDRAVDCLAGLVESKKYGWLAIDTLARLLGLNDALERSETAPGREARIVANEDLRDEVLRVLDERRQ
jgi:hypothetical protein